MESIKLKVETRPMPARKVLDWRLRQNLPLYIMLLPCLIGLLLFKFYPIYGISIAFQQFDPLMGFARSPWVGFSNFQRLFARPEFVEILRNTLMIASGKIFLGQFFAIVFALLLNEVRFHPFKRLVQSLTYLPYFLSWLVFGAIMVDVLELNGILNSGLALLGLPRIYFLGDANLFPWTMIFTDIFKGFGWGAIIYLAAITGIDPALYEAAAVDGASRWQRMRHITLPGLSPTIIIMLTLSLGWIMSAGFEQILVMYSPVVYRTGDIIDTYVYRTGLLSFQYSLAAAVGLFKSVIGFALIGFSFYCARRFANYRLF